MALQPGTQLGPYEIVSPIGSGGMGEVYRARDTRLDRTVAIKVLSSDLSSDSELRGRMQREARAISSLNHPHICTLHDIGQENGIDFLVMEFLPDPRPSKPLLVLQNYHSADLDGLPGYDVAPDGRHVIVRRPEIAPPTEQRVILNWSPEP